MTTRRQRRLEETQRTLSEDSSSGDDAERTVVENSEEERQLLSITNDTEEVASTTNEDDDIIIDEVNIAVTAQVNTKKANSNGTADINHGLNTMSVSDKVKRALSVGSDGSPSCSTLPQDVEMQNTAPTENNETKEDHVKSVEKEEEGKEDRDSPKTEKIATTELLAIPSSSKDQVVNINYADLTAFIANIATKITNGNVPPSAPKQEIIKFKEPEVAAKKQEVRNSLKTVLLKDTNKCLFNITSYIYTFKEILQLIFLLLHYSK